MNPDHVEINQHRDRLRGDGLIDPSVLVSGLDVKISHVLPLSPTPGDDARRLVRHAYASMRNATGEAMYFPDSLGDVGPLPGDDAHAVQIGNTLHVSREGFDRLRGHITARDTGVRRGV